MIDAGSVEALVEALVWKDVKQLTHDLARAVRAAAGCIGANAGTCYAIGIDGSGTSVMMMTAYGFPQILNIG